MSNCLVAQSGGPTAVINATIAGVVKANQMNPYYDKVYGGLNGIEGILQERFVDLTDMSDMENNILRQTPSSALGSCRYKLKRENVQDFEKLSDDTATFRGFWKNKVSRILLIVLLASLGSSIGTFVSGLSIFSSLINNL